MKINILCIFLFLSSCLFAFYRKDYKIYDTNKHKYVQLEDIVKDFKKANVLFFGEIHDDSLMHDLESELLQKINAEYLYVAVSMEMFERDVQPSITQYCKNILREADFIKQSRAWPNYISDYKAIMEYCKLNRLELIASNIPRRIAVMVNRQGLSILDSLSIQDRKYVARQINTETLEYKNRFMELMKSGMSMTPNHINLSQKMLDKLFFAQCVKDDTMAESINDYLMSNPNFKIIHYNGEFHSDYHLGTVERIRPEYKTITISSLIKDRKSPLQISKEDDLKKADYLIIQYSHGSKQ